jgi:hypothetical protein
MCALQWEEINAYAYAYAYQSLGLVRKSRPTNPLVGGVLLVVTDHIQG